MRVVSFGRAAIQQRISGEGSVNGYRKGKILLVRVASSDRAQKPSLSVAHVPQKESINSQEIKELIVTFVPKAHDVINILSNEIA